MASTMIEVLGDRLLTEPIDPNANQMPSPEKLMYKFIIKHKGLSEKVDGDQTVIVKHRDNRIVL